MTVNELIQLLAAHPADLRVVVNGYESGYDDLSPGQLSLVKISLNTGKNPWDGKHGEPNGLSKSTADSAEVPNSPRPTLRIADDNFLLASGFGQWDRYVNARIDTSHDYSSEKARRALAIVGDFIDDAIGLYQTMTGETWE